LLKEVSQSGAALISTQVPQELVICLRRKVAGPLENMEIRKIVSELLDEWEVFVNNSKSVLHSLEIEDRHKTSFGMRSSGMQRKNPPRRLYTPKI
jgi:predicted nucleic acid-binding protein